MKSALMWVLGGFAVVYWSVLIVLVSLVLGILCLVFWPFVEERLQTSSPPRGLAPRARPKWESETDVCGCCGRAAVVGQLWCFDCAFHIRAHRDIHERTWYAQHGTICPFTEIAEDDCVVEGLGTIHPQGHHVTPLEQLTKGERELWDEARRGIA